MSQHAFISALLAAWEAADYPVGVGDHLRIRQLLQSLPPDFDKKDLKTRLAPILAHDKEQQQEFYSLFDKTLAEIEALESETSGIEHRTSDIATPSVWKRFLPLWIIFSLGLVFGLYWLTKPNEGKIPNITFVEPGVHTIRLDSGIIRLDTIILPLNPYEHSPDLGITPSKFNWRFGWQKAYMSPTKWALLLLASLALLGIGWWWQRRQRKLILDYKPNEKPPYGWSLTIPKAERISHGEILHETALKMRRRSAVDDQRLDLNRTINATILRGGVVDFKYQNLTRTHEYLLLIDSHAPQNHQAQLFDYLYRLYTQQEVLIERFFYDSDMRLCWNEQHKGGISLVALQHKYSEHGLIVMGSGLALLNPVTGWLNRWASVLDGWNTRALITPRPIAEWDKREMLLSQKFQILPSTLKGVSTLAETLESTEPIDYRLWQTHHNPDTEPLYIPENLKPETLIEFLKSEYTTYDKGEADDSLLRWIAACTVSPVLHWDWTLHVAHILSQTQTTPPESLLNIENLFLLNRLPWFIEGKIPKETRIALSNWLKQRDPALFHAALLAWGEILNLEQNIPPTDSLAYEDYKVQFLFNQLQLQVPNRKAVLEELERLLPHHEDALAVEYLKREPTEIDVLLPPTFRKFVVDTEGVVPKVKDWVKNAFWWVLLVGLMGLGISMAYQKKAETYVMSVSANKYVLDDIDKQFVQYAKKMLDFWQKPEYRKDSTYSILLTDSLPRIDSNVIDNIVKLASTLTQKAESDDEFIFYIAGSLADSSSNCSNCELDRKNESRLWAKMKPFLQNSKAKKKIIITELTLPINLQKDSSYYLPNIVFLSGNRADTSGPNIMFFKDLSFSGSLLRGLQGYADINKDSIVTLEEAISSIYFDVKTTRDQRFPVFLNTLDKNMPLSKWVEKVDTVQKGVVKTPKKIEELRYSGSSGTSHNVLSLVLFSLSLLIIVYAFWGRSFLTSTLTVFLTYLIFHLVLTFCSWFFQLMGKEIALVVYNLSYLSDVALLGWFFYLVFIPQPRIARIIRFISIVLFFVVTVNIIFTIGFNNFNDYNEVMTSFYGLILSALFIGFLYKEKSLISIKKKPLFWLNLGLLLAHIIPIYFFFPRIFPLVNLLVFNSLYLLFNIIGQVLIGIGYYHAQFVAEKKTTKASYKENIIKFIEEGLLDEALEALLKATENTKWYIEIVQQSGRYRSNQQYVMKGFITDESATLERNKIRASLLDIIYRLPEIETSNDRKKISNTEYFTASAEPKKAIKTVDTREVEKCIAERRIKEALEILRSMSQDTEWDNEAVLLSHQYQELEKRQIQGIITSEEASIIRNKINVALSSLIYNLGEDKMPSSITVIANNWTKWLIAIVAALASVVSIFVYFLKTSNLLQGIQLYELGLFVLGFILLLVIIFMFLYSALKGKANLLLLWGLIIPIFMIGYPSYRSAQFSKDVVKIDKLVENVNTLKTTTVTANLRDINGKFISFPTESNLIMALKNAKTQKEGAPVKTPSAPISSSGKVQFNSNFINIGDTIVGFSIGSGSDYRVIDPSSHIVITENAEFKLYVEHRFTFFGTVNEFDTPLSGVEVMFFDKDKMVIGATTDKNGNFNIFIPDNLYQEKMQIRCLKQGYKPLILTVIPKVNLPFNIVMEKEN